MHTHNNSERKETWYETTANNKLGVCLLWPGPKKKHKKRHHSLCITVGYEQQNHAPPREGELEGVLDEAIATRADHEGGPGLDAVLHHHVCRHTAGVQRHLPNPHNGRGE